MIDDREAEGFSIRPACRVAQVSTSAYYAWADSPTHDRLRILASWAADQQVPASPSLI